MVALHALLGLLTSSVLLADAHPAEHKPVEAARRSELGRYYKYPWLVDLLPLPGTDPRILNGSCPTFNNGSACPPPSLPKIYNMTCGDFDTGSRTDLSQRILERYKWRYVNKNKWARDYCHVPAKRCRRFACVDTTGVYACNHNGYNIELKCVDEIHELARRISEGCCTRKGPWASEGVSGQLTTDQGWRVAVAYANCSQPEDAIVPSETDLNPNGKCENPSTGGDFISHEFVSSLQGVWPTTRWFTGGKKTPTQILPKPEETWTPGQVFTTTTSGDSGKSSSAALTTSAPKSTSSSRPFRALAHKTIKTTGSHRTIKAVSTPAPTKKSTLTTKPTMTTNSTLTTNSTVTTKSTLKASSKAVLTNKPSATQ